MELIRRALEADAEHIHNAHMESIRTVCCQDHSAQEIAVWGGRPYNASKWISAIQNDLVWAVEVDSKIAGYGHLRILQVESQTKAHIHGLYLTYSALGKKIGFQLTLLMMQKSREAGAISISLESSLTAHAFYQRLGFKDTGPQTSLEIAGQPVRCYQMILSLR